MHAPLARVVAKLTDHADKFYDLVATGNALVSDALHLHAGDFLTRLFEVGDAQFTS